MNCLNGFLNYLTTNTAKYFLNTFAFLFTISSCFFSANTQAGVRVCEDNNGAGFQIRDYNNSTRVLGTINVPIPFNVVGDESVLQDVNVELDITHQWVGELTARVTSPSSASEVTLFERPGTPNAEGQNPFPPNFGCNENNIDAVFDDESTNPPIENVPCFNQDPVFSGDYKPHNAAPNDLSTYDGENPIGNWNIYLSDSFGTGSDADEFDGTLNEACVDIDFASVNFDQWVSTLPGCSDNVDNISVFSGTDVYYCYVVSNPGTEAFTINPGDITNDLGHDLTPLETTYPAETSPAPLVIGPLTAGILDLTVGASPIVNNTEVTATFATPNFTGTLGPTSETTTVTVTAPIEISKASMVISDPANSTNPKSIPGAIVEYTISVSNAGPNTIGNDSIVIDDPLPPNTRLFFGSPLETDLFVDGLLPSGLTLNFIDPANATDDVRFFNSNGEVITPTVSSGLDATSPPIDQIRFEPKGTFNESIDGINTPSFEIKFRVRVE